MLSARQNVAATAAQAAPQPIAQPAPAAPQFAPAYEAAAPVYAQPAPVYAYPAPATAITTLGLGTGVMTQCRKPTSIWMASWTVGVTVTRSARPARQAKGGLTARTGFGTPVTPGGGRLLQRGSPPPPPHDEPPPGFFSLKSTAGFLSIHQTRTLVAHEPARNCCPPWTGEAGWRSARPGLFTGIVEEVPQVGGWPLRQHVVMLVGMDDKVRGLDSVRRHHLLPALECLVMVLNDKINRTTGPCEQPLQFAQRLVEQGKVIQIYVEDDRHRLPA